MRLVNNRVKNVDRVELTPATATNKSTTKKVCNVVLAGKMQKEDLGKFTFHDNTCLRSFYWNSETQNMYIQMNRKML